MSWLAYMGTKLKTADTDKAILPARVGTSSTRSGLPRQSSTLPVATYVFTPALTLVTRSDHPAGISSSPIGSWDVAMEPSCRLSLKIK